MQSNRDVIVEAIAAMDEEALGKFLSDYDTEKIDTVSCSDCQAHHGGDCPGGLNSCTDAYHVQWLSWACQNPARLRRALIES